VTVDLGAIVAVEADAVNLVGNHVLASFTVNSSKPPVTQVTTTSGTVYGSKTLDASRSF